MKLLSFLFRYSPKTIFFISIVGVISGLSNAGLIAIIHKAMNDTETPMALYVWGFIGMTILTLVTTFVSQYVFFRLSQYAIFDLNLDLSREILRTPLRHLEEIGNAKLLVTLTNDVYQITASLGGLPLLFKNIIIVVGCLLYLAWLSWQVFLLVAFIMVFVVVSYVWPFRVAKISLMAARKDLNFLYKHYDALLDGIKELKLHHNRRLSFINEHLKMTAASTRDHNIKGHVLFFIASNMGRLLYIICLGFLVFLIPKFVEMDFEVLSGFVLTILYIAAPLNVMTNWFPILSRSNVAFDEVRSLGLKLEELGREDFEDLNLPPVGDWKKLELKDVEHTYHNRDEDREFTLGPINLSFEPGELVYIIGGNGSGKTTLAKVFTGLYTPESGQIEVDGQAVDRAHLEWYRQHFSVVFADFYLFDTLMGISHPNLDESALDYLVKLRLNHKVQVKDGTFSTIDLSFGQRKRLALLTVYLEDRPIYLFDEWAAGQDPEFKDLFYNIFLPELRKRGKTIIVITHDDTYFHIADRLIKVNNGQITFDGKPSEEFLEHHVISDQRTSG